MSTQTQTPITSDEQAKALRKQLAAFSKAKPKKERAPLSIKNEKHAGSVIVNGEIGKAKIARDQQKAFAFLAAVNGDAAEAYLETMQRGIAAAQAAVVEMRKRAAAAAAAAATPPKQ